MQDTKQHLETTDMVTATTRVTGAQAALPTGAIGCSEGVAIGSLLWMEQQRERCKGVCSQVKLARCILVKGVYLPFLLGNSSWL